MVIVHPKAHTFDHSSDTKTAVKKIHYGIEKILSPHGSFNICPSKYISEENESKYDGSES